MNLSEHKVKERKKEKIEFIDANLWYFFGAWVVSMLMFFAGFALVASGFNSEKRLVSGIGFTLYGIAAIASSVLFVVSLVINLIQYVSAVGV